MLEKRSILQYELIGMVFIILLGSVLHFTFEWSGNQPIVGVFSAVNESVWEHLKIAFWPALLYLIIEYRYLYKESNNFFAAKTLGIYSIIVMIPLIFYSYTAFLEESLIIDIGSFIFTIIIGQLVSYKLLTYKKFAKIFEQISFVALVVLALAFVVFTFYPPQVPFFQDPITGEYGIVDHSHQDQINIQKNQQLDNGQITSSSLLHVETIRLASQQIAKCVRIYSEFPSAKT